MSINISATKNKPRAYGNSFLARSNRLKRRKQGIRVSFSDDLVYPEKNPFGTNSVVNNGWNERFDYIRQFKKEVVK